MNRWRGFVGFYLRSGYVVGLVLALLAGILRPAIPISAVVIGSLIVFVLTVVAAAFRYRRLAAREARDEVADREAAAGRAVAGFDAAGVDVRALRFGICHSGPHQGLWLIVQPADGAQTWRYLVPGPGWSPSEAASGQGVSRGELDDVLAAWEVRFLSAEDLRRPSEVVERYRAELLFHGFSLTPSVPGSRRRRRSTKRA